MDDLLLFVEASNQGNVIHEVLARFCEILGQKINMNKPKLYVSSNMGDDMGTQFSNTFGIPLTRDLGIYLGTLLVHRRVNKLTYGFLVDKVRRRMSSWKKRILSRMLLIRTTISIISAFVMQLVAISQSTIMELEKVLEHSFGKRTLQQKKLHTVV